jgi:hypothetical protein
LRGDVGVRILGDLPRQIDETSSRRRRIDDEVRQTLADVAAFDGQGAILK